ncbi:hypothetical protein FALBO_16079 [Fusarium albosuccineum]|uniref:Uncharacterized protein n=1 Tax=Fusarium albosuccineum TaxID=1237068 RepID=A0A8H4P1V7_9HYPO|nr:hypothetical protein FALBO_16079 [Fusarium albosuccineum]
MDPPGYPGLEPEVQATVRRQRPFPATAWVPVEEEIRPMHAEVRIGLGLTSSTPQPQQVVVPSRGCSNRDGNGHRREKFRSVGDVVMEGDSEDEEFNLPNGVSYPCLQRSPGVANRPATQLLNDTTLSQVAEDQHKLAKIKRVWDRFSHTWDEETKATIVSHLVDIVTWPTNETQPSGHKLWKMTIENQRPVPPPQWAHFAIWLEPMQDEVEAIQHAAPARVMPWVITNDPVTQRIQRLPAGRMSYNGVLRYRKAQKCVGATPYIKKHDEAVTQPAAESEPQDSSRLGLKGVHGQTINGTPTTLPRQNSLGSSSPAARPQTPTPSKNSPLSRASSSGDGAFSRFMETKKRSAMSANTRRKHSVVEVASSHASPSHSPQPPQHLADPFVEPPREPT